MVSSTSSTSSFTRSLSVPEAPVRRRRPDGEYRVGGNGAVSGRRGLLPLAVPADDLPHKLAEDERTTGFTAGSPHRIPLGRCQSSRQRMDVEVARTDTC
jgi:hypothetical protein